MSRDSKLGFVGIKTVFSSAYGVVLFLLATLISAPVMAEIREYWVAAEKVDWNYAPSGKNLVRPAMGLGPWGEKTIYPKYRYIQYTDGSYQAKVPQPKWMGILGPQLRAEVGDTLKVHFLNRADKPLSMHPHGLNYDEDNDGADHRGKGGIIKPGEKYTYTWHADAGSGPASNDESSIVWVYHSHVDAVQEVYDGLIGTIVVTKKGWATSNTDLKAKDVDHEFTTMFMVFDEEEGEEGGLMHTMNGYIFANLEGYQVNEGDTVRWHLIAMGSEVDLHTAHWHGETVTRSGRRTDVINLLPSSMESVTMLADNPGTWLYHCHVADHIVAGMVTRWSVLPKKK